MVNVHAFPETDHCQEISCEEEWFQESGTVTRTGMSQLLPLLSFSLKERGEGKEKGMRKVRSTPVSFLSHLCLPPFPSFSPPPPSSNHYLISEPSQKEAQLGCRENSKCLVYATVVKVSQKEPSLAYPNANTYLTIFIAFSVTIGILFWLQYCTYPNWSGGPIGFGYGGSTVP